MLHPRFAPRGHVATGRARARLGRHGLDGDDRTLRPVIGAIRSGPVDGQPSLRPYVRPPCRRPRAHHRWHGWQPGHGERRGVRPGDGSDLDHRLARDGTHRRRGGPAFRWSCHGGRWNPGQRCSTQRRALRPDHRDLPAGRVRDAACTSASRTACPTVACWSPAISPRCSTRAPRRRSPRSRPRSDGPFIATGDPIEDRVGHPRDPAALMAGCLILGGWSSDVWGSDPDQLRVGGDLRSEDRVLHVDRRDARLAGAGCR